MKQGYRAVLRMILVAAAAVAFSGCDGGATAGGTSTSPTLNALLSGVVNQSSVPAAVMCMTEASGRTWVGASGAADLMTGEAASGADLFRIASNSKTFTATAVLLVRDDGRVDLDAPIADFVHDFGIPHDDVITVRMLLNHTSGLADHENDTPWLAEQQAAGHSPEYEPQELVDAALAVAPDLLFAPGQGYHYSNTGYVVLSVIVERITGSPFEDFVRTRIIEPFGLTHTYILPGAEMPATPYARGYTFAPNGTSFADSTVMNESWDVGAGGMISTVCDLASFVRLLFGGQILSADSLAQMETFSAQKNYGLGCHHDPGLGWGHDGSTDGYNSLMAYEPADGVAYAAFVNGTRNDQAWLISLFSRFREAARTFKRDLGYAVP